MTATTANQLNRVRTRAILLGVALMPLHAFWITKIEAILYKAGGGSTASLIWTSVYNLVILMALSQLVRRWRPRMALNPAELLAIFAMCNIAVCIAGHDRLQILVPLIAYPQWYATPENEWANVLLPYLRDAITVTDRTTLLHYFVGESSLYVDQHLRHWLTPALMWSGFFAVLLLVQLALNGLVQKKWTEVDRLAYPVVQLPLRLASPSRSFLGNPLLWWGFATSGGILCINSLHRLLPVAPQIRLSYELGRYFTEAPWNAIGWLPFNVIFNYIGLGFFVPLDILFSCWFFLLLFKGQTVLGRILGIRSLPNFPYSYEQAAGGYLALGVIAVWVTRKHFWKIARALMLRTSDMDAAEAKSYRISVSTLVIGSGLIVLFCSYLGMAAWVAVSFFGMYYLLQLAVARMRAEIGTPLHDLHFAGPSTILMNLLGSGRFTHSSLVGMAQLWCIDRAYRSNAMPHQLETFKMAERLKTERKGMVLALIVASVLAAPIAFWMLLHQSYEIGIQNAAPVNVWFGYEPWNRFQAWIGQRTGTNVPSMGFTFFGFGMTLLFMWGRLRFIWWPFHPIGYALSGSWQMNWGWGSFFVAWLIKWSILKWSGIHGYRRATAYFLGLLMGEVFIGGTWAVAGVVFNFW